MFVNVFKGLATLCGETISGIAWPKGVNTLDMALTLFDKTTCQSWCGMVATLAKGIDGTILSPLQLCQRKNADNLYNI